MWKLYSSFCTSGSYIRSVYRSLNTCRENPDLTTGHRQLQKSMPLRNSHLYHGTCMLVESRKAVWADIDFDIRLSWLCIEIHLTHTTFHFPQYDHRPLHERLSDQQFPVDAKQNPNTLRFNETVYILGSSRDNTDAYKKNAFNQAESDKLPSNRKIPDTRHSRFVACLWLVKDP